MRGGYLPSLACIRHEVIAGCNVNASKTFITSVQLVARPRYERGRTGGFYWVVPKIIGSAQHSAGGVSLEPRLEPRWLEPNRLLVPEPLWWLGTAKL